MYIDWNEQVHPDENNSRISRMLENVSTKTKQENRFVGQQQFLVNQGIDLSFSEAELYLSYTNQTEKLSAQTELIDYMHQYHPQAVYRFYAPNTLFDRIFQSGNAPLTAALSHSRKSIGFTPNEINTLITDIKNELRVKNEELRVGSEKLTLNSSLLTLNFREYLRVDINNELMLLYNVNYNTLIQELRTACHDNNIGLLRSYQEFVPLVIGGESLKVGEMIDRLMIRNRYGAEIPLRALVQLQRDYDLKTITAGKEGEYVPVNFNISEKDYPQIVSKVKEVVNRYPDVEVSFFGSIFENRQMIRELILVLVVSILIMYFILAAQFESLLQPIILLIELPIDIAVAIFLLKITGNTLNLMSAIGIIVMCAIIINDSILKIDTINRLRREGMSIDKAIHTAGIRRLKAIVLTSLTTIFAVLPLLFSKDMGAELQQPFAWALISGMIIGTLVSLFFIPIAYKAIYRLVT